MTVSILPVIWLEVKLEMEKEAESLREISLGIIPQVVNFGLLAEG